MPEEGKIPYGTPEKQLQILNEAIYNILMGGQSYKIGTRSLTRADLGTLITERNRLEAHIQGDVYKRQKVHRALYYTFDGVPNGASEDYNLSLIHI